MDERPDIDWTDVLARMRREIRRGADRIEVDLDNDIVRGMQVSGRSHANTDTSDG